MDDPRKRKTKAELLEALQKAEEDAKAAYEEGYNDAMAVKDNPEDKKDEEACF